MDTKTNHYILIMCGGSGPRLWPLSRASFPKQFLKLFGQNSLIKDTFLRFQKVVPTKNIFFVSHQKYKDELQKEFGKLVAPGNYLSEPDKKNTAMAILYGTMAIKKLNPQAVITAAPSDHFIGNTDRFKSNLDKAAKIASTTDKIVTIGIKPLYPNPGFGYILPHSAENTYQTVGKFIEKPSVIDAQLLIKKDALWNSGIYTFRADTIISELSQHCPEFIPIIKKLSQTSSPSVLQSIYKIAPKIPIDVAVSEKSQNMATFKATFDWSDVGEWKAIWQHLNPSGDGIGRLNNQGTYLSVNSKNCLLSGDNKKLIGLVGLNNLAIIDTPDSLLVCNLNDTFAVRDLVTKIVSDPKLKKHFLGNYDR